MEEWKGEFRRSLGQRRQKKYKECQRFRRVSALCRGWPVESAIDVVDEIQLMCARYLTLRIVSEKTVFAKERL